MNGLFEKSAMDGRTDSENAAQKQNAMLGSVWVRTAPGGLRSETPGVADRIRSVPSRPKCHVNVKTELRPLTGPAFNSLVFILNV